MIPSLKSVFGEAFQAWQLLPPLLPAVTGALPGPREALFPWNPAAAEFVPEKASAEYKELLEWKSMELEDLLARSATRSAIVPRLCAEPGVGGGAC
ncbi:MAG: hypothetical protein ACKPKO_34535, partial [Candidatus Fonsibacter sp.]